MLGFYFSRIPEFHRKKLLMRSKRCQTDVTPRLFSNVIPPPNHIHIIYIKERVRGANGTASRVWWRLLNKAPSMISSRKKALKLAAKGPHLKTKAIKMNMSKRRKSRLTTKPGMTVSKPQNDGRNHGWRNVTSPPKHATHHSISIARRGWRSPAISGWSTMRTRPRLIVNVSQ